MEPEGRLRLLAGLDASPLLYCAAFIHPWGPGPSSGDLDDLAAGLELDPPPVPLPQQSLVVKCRLKVEQMALCGDLDLRQLQVFADHYLPFLPLSVTRAFVQSLFLKSLTNLYPLRSLLGRLHLVFSYSLLRKVSLQCNVGHGEDVYVDFAIPEGMDGYFCSDCSATACEECLVKCFLCHRLACKDSCGTLRSCAIPQISEEDWLAAGRPLPLTLDKKEVWLCSQCDPEVFEWATKAQTEYEDSLWASDEDFSECVRCGRSVRSWHGGRMLLAKMRRRELKLFEECRLCMDSKMCEDCADVCEHCESYTCPKCMPGLYPCALCFKENVCKRCLLPLELLGSEDGSVACWDCYKTAEECKKRLVSMVAFLDPEDLTAELQHQLATAIARHGGRVAESLGPRVTHLITSADQPAASSTSASSPPYSAEPGGMWVVVKPKLVLSWIARLTPAPRP